MKKIWFYLFLSTGFFLFRSTSCNDEEEKDPEPVNFTLTVAISPTTGGNVSKSPDQNKYVSGTSVTLQANPATNYQFTRWEGDATGTSGQTSVTMNSNKNVTAFFTALQYTLTVAASPATGGSVTRSPDLSQYASGTNVVLTAVPASGYQFIRWEGDMTGTASQITVTMNSSKNVTAVFTPLQRTLTVTISPASGGSVTKSPDQNQYASGTNVVLTANPASGYQFTRWEGDVAGTASQITVTMNSNKNVTAVFTATGNPLIQLSRTNLTFTATSGGTAPSSQTINITNGGTGTLSGLSRAFPGMTLPLWLTASLNQTTAPAVLTVGVSMTNPMGGTFGPGTYSARIAINSTNAGNSPQYIDVTFTIQPQVLPRSITLINNSPTSLGLKDIVQVKIAKDESGVYVRNDLLTNDGLKCLSAPGESISPGKSMKFNITIGPNYSVFIGLGTWSMDFGECGVSSSWCKLTRGLFANQQGTTDLIYIWTVVNVTDHQSGNMDWIVSGSYLDGTTAVTIVTSQGQTKIPFKATKVNPIP